MLKINRMIVTIFLCACCIALASCQRATTDLDTPPTGNSSPMSIATLQSYPTPINVFEYPDQVTDGILLFSIEAADDGRSKVGNPIEIKLTFKNLTGKTIQIPVDFSVAVNRRGDGGNLIPFITTTDAVDVHAPGDFQLVDIFSTPSRLYREISAGQSVDFEIEFRFPKYLAVNVSEETIDLVTPTPGQYLIRFVFLEYERGADVWHGAIGSNRIEICILN